LDFAGLESGEWWQQLAREEDEATDCECELDSEEEQAPCEEAEPGVAACEAAAQAAMTARCGINYSRPHVSVVGRRTLGRADKAWGSAGRQSRGSEELVGVDSVTVDNPVKADGSRGDNRAPQVPVPQWSVSTVTATRHDECNGDEFEEAAAEETSSTGLNSENMRAGSAEAMVGDAGGPAATKRSRRRGRQKRQGEHAVADSGEAQGLCRGCLRKELLEQQASACGLVLQVEELLDRKLGRNDRALYRRRLAEARALKAMCEERLADLEGPGLCQSCDCGELGGMKNFDAGLATCQHLG
jgi:hypothetical protein